MNMSDIFAKIGIAVSALFLVGGLIYFMFFTSCYENKRAYDHGGTVTVELPKGQAFVNCTWKDSSTSVSLWYLTRQAKTNEVATTYTWQEKSQKGVREGTVIFKENF